MLMMLISALNGRELVFSLSVNDKPEWASSLTLRVVGISTPP